MRIGASGVAADATAGWALPADVDILVGDNGCGPKHKEQLDAGARLDPASLIAGADQ